MLKLIAQLVKIINSQTDPHQISLAFAFSMIAGLTPLISLHNLLVLLLILILRVNLSAFILGLAVFSGLAYLLNPVFHKLGLIILTCPPLENLWTSLYNSPVWRLERFNNTVVMGSLFFSLILFFPVHLLLKSAIAQYREVFITWANKLRIVQLIKASKFFSIYQSIAGHGEL